MVFQQILVVEKLNRIVGYLDEAKKILEVPSEAIRSDIEKLRALERVFQLIVDEILDINQHFIKELNLKISDDLEGTFHILGENNILPDDFALKIAPVVGLRNRLVHRYEEIDNKLFVETFQKERSDFEQYIQYISEYLDKKIQG